MPGIRQDAVGQDADGVALVRFDNDVLERHEVDVLAKEVHPAHRSVHDTVHLPARCFLR
jgi:hypothetical protein